MQEPHACRQDDEDSHRTDQKTGDTASQPVEGNVDRGDIHILEGLVMLPVIDHRPRDSCHDSSDIGIKGIAEINIREER